MSHSLRLGILGAGNMGALLAKQIASASLSQFDLFVADPNFNKLSPLEMLGVKCFSSLSDLLPLCDVILFAIKPQQFHELFKGGDCFDFQNKKIISIMAGISFSQLEKLGSSLPCIRVMPNTPAQIGLGASALLANADSDSNFKFMTETIFRLVGKIAWLETESELNAMTALSGSGVAYFFFLMEIMEKVGVKLGLPADISKTFTLQTAIGASQLASESHLSFEQLREQVTSKGGTTQAAISLLQNRDFHGMIHDAMMAAMQRAKILGEFHD